MENKDRDVPFLIESTKSGMWRIKRGVRKDSENGGSVSWKLVGEYGSLTDAAADMEVISMRSRYIK